ncbi:ribonuclease T2-like protein [Xylogone sp. PMI_703]|nr:ribonuclease T2-like protein [Xylogone sp. PMI_703]
MASIRNLLNFASGLLTQTPLTGSPASSYNHHEPYSNSPTCPLDGPISCHNVTDGGDSCCFIYPGGQLLQTQFWDTHPSIGPEDSWTLHGLWPDNCDGSYPQYCHSAPTYHSITQVLTEAGQQDLLDYMNKYWLPNSGTNEHFWQHEWNKHGTCINTLSPSCYADLYNSGDEVVDFFTRAVEVFKGLDTYKALAAAGIYPSKTRRHTLQELEDALQSVTGFKVVLGCSRGALNQAWYTFNVKGSLQTGEFVPTNPAGPKGSCPRRGIKYLPK